MNIARSIGTHHPAAFRVEIMPEDLGLLAAVYSTANKHALYAYRRVYINVPSSKLYADDPTTENDDEDDVENRGVGTAARWLWCSDGRSGGGGGGAFALNRTEATL